VDDLELPWALDREPGEAFTLGRRCPKREGEAIVCPVDVGVVAIARVLNGTV
jgi:hypothetical protein